MTTAIQIMVVVGMVAFAMYTIGKIIYQQVQTHAGADSKDCC